MLLNFDFWNVYLHSKPGISNPGYDPRLKPFRNPSSYNPSLKSRPFSLPLSHPYSISLSLNTRLCGSLFLSIAISSQIQSSAVSHYTSNFNFLLDPYFFVQKMDRRIFYFCFYLSPVAAFECSFYYRILWRLKFKSVTAELNFVIYLDWFNFGSGLN